MPSQPPKAGLQPKRKRSHPLFLAAIMAIALLACLLLVDVLFPGRTWYGASAPAQPPGLQETSPAAQLHADTPPNSAAAEKTSTDLHEQALEAGYEEAVGIETVRPQDRSDDDQPTMAVSGSVLDDGGHVVPGAVVTARRVAVPSLTGGGSSPVQTQVNVTTDLETRNRDQQVREEDWNVEQVVIGGKV